jgi:hypothetical protein
VVECAALEMRFTGNRNVGSNPTLSAMLEQVQREVRCLVGLRAALPAQRLALLLLARIQKLELLVR